MKEIVLIILFKKTKIFYALILSSFKKLLLKKYNILSKFIKSYIL